MSCALQELSLFFEDDVFASGVVVLTMNEEYLHNLPFPACRSCWGKNWIKPQFEM